MSKRLHRRCDFCGKKIRGWWRMSIHLTECHRDLFTYSGRRTWCVCGIHFIDEFQGDEFTQHISQAGNLKDHAMLSALRGDHL